MEKLIKKASGGMKSPGNIIYLDYPEYEGSGTSGYPGAEIALKIGVPNKLPVGHNAFVLVDDNGGTLFYEYGRYNQGDGGMIQGTYKPGKGNWVRRTIADIPKKQDGTLDYEGWLKTAKIPHGKGKVNATVIKNTNNDAVRGYIKAASGNFRMPYNLANTCATLGGIATTIGMMTHPISFINAAAKNIGITGLPSAIKGAYSFVRNAIDSKGWALIPGSSQQKGADMSRYGTTYRLNK